MTPADLALAEYVAARNRLRELVPHLRIAAELARAGVPGGEVKLAIAAYAANGSGQMGAVFEWESFLADLETLSTAHGAFMWEWETLRPVLVADGMVQAGHNGPLTGLLVRCANAVAAAHMRGACL